MTKKDLAGIMTLADRESEKVDSAVETLVQILEAGFNRLANLHPDGAVQMIDQLYGMRQAIIDTGAHNEAAIQATVNQVAANLPDSLELEEDYEN